MPHRTGPSLRLAVVHTNPDGKNPPGRQPILAVERILFGGTARRAASAGPKTQRPIDRVCHDFRALRRPYAAYPPPEPSRPAGPAVMLPVDAERIFQARHDAIRNTLTGSEMSLVRLRSDVVRCVDPSTRPGAGCRGTAPTGRPAPIRLRPSGRPDGRAGELMFASSARRSRLSPDRSRRVPPTDETQAEYRSDRLLTALCPFLMACTYSVANSQGIGP